MAFEFSEHQEFVELHLFGEITGAAEPGDEWYGRIARHGRLLVDAADVNAIAADVMWMAGIVDKARAAGPFWVAVYAPADVVFGVFRQVAAYRSDPAPTVDFFREREAAVAWLLSRDEIPAA